MPRFVSSCALAALGLALAGVAAAQSSVSIYGLVDVSAGRFQDAGAPKIYKLESGKLVTSYLGFKGSEDLGGGLRANFALEGFLRADSGASGRFNGDTFWARAAWVGLSSAELGSVQLGRVTNLYFVSTLAFNAYVDSFGYSPSIRQMLTPRAGMQPFYGDTGWSNALNYASPKFAGFSLGLQANLGEGAAGATGRNVGGALNYAQGPLAATLAAQSVKNNNGNAFAPPAGFDRQDSVQAGLSYDFGVAKLMGQVARSKTKAAVDTKQTYAGLGASIPLGAGKVLAQYGRSKYDTAGADPVNKTFTVGYHHPLSKLTEVYVLAMNDKFTGVDSGNTVAAGLRLRF